MPVPRTGRAHAAARGAGIAGHPAGSPARPADTLGQAVDLMVQWCQRADRPLWLVEGGPRAGKTALLAEAADRLTHRRWRCGWARPGRAAAAVLVAARYRRRTLVLVDDGETRAELAELVRVLANGGRPLPVRVIVAARTFDGWWPCLMEGLTAAERDGLTAARTVVTAPLVQPAPAGAADADATTGPGSTPLRSAPAGADPGGAVVLLRLAALVVALPTRLGELGSAEIRAAIWNLLAGRGYWRRIGAEVSPPGAPVPALRAALACAAAVGPDGLGDAGTVLRRVPALATGAGDRLARLVLRWRELMAGAANATPTADGPPIGLAGAHEGPSAVTWTVAALTAERRASAVLARLARQAHRDIWAGRATPPPGDPTAAPVAGPAAGPAPAVEPAPAAPAVPGPAPAVGPVDEALAWLVSELDLRPAELRTLGEAIVVPTWSLSRTAMVLARRLLPITETEQERAALRLALSGRLAELGRWEQARQVAAEALAELRILAGFNRARHLADLAAAASTLGWCLAQLGEHRQAAVMADEAVTLYGELVATRPHRYPSGLAMAEQTQRICRVVLAASLAGGETGQQ